MNEQTIILNPTAPETQPPEVRVFLDTELVSFASWVDDYSDRSVASSSAGQFAFQPRLVGWASDGRGFSTFETELRQPSSDQERDELRLEIRRVIMEQQPLYLAYVGLCDEGFEGGLGEQGDICGRQLLVSTSWNSLGDAVLSVRQLEPSGASWKLKQPWPIDPSQRLGGWLPDVIRRTMATAFVLRKAGVSEVSRLV